MYWQCLKCDHENDDSFDFCENLICEYCGAEYEKGWDYIDPYEGMITFWIEGLVKEGLNMETYEKVVNVISSCADVEEDKIHKNAHLENDLGIDSLDSFEIILSLEEEFDITVPIEKVKKISYVEDLVKVVNEEVSK